MKNGLILVKPTSVDKTGTGSTATISTNGSVEFSACTELSLNGVFSADYDNYMVVCRHTSGVASSLQYRLRLQGLPNTDASGTNYTGQVIEASSTTVSANRDSTINWGYAGSVGGTERGGLIFYIYGPFLAQPTASRGLTVTGFGGALLTDRATTHSLSTSYFGITFIPASTNFSGRVAVYGMRK